MAFTEREKEAVGWALRTGEFAKLSKSKQISIFVKGYGDNPNELERLSKSSRMFDAYNKRIITFHPGALAHQADKIRAKASKNAQHADQSTNIKDAKTGKPLSLSEVMTKAGIAAEEANKAAMNMGQPIQTQVQVVNESTDTATKGLGFNYSHFVSGGANQSNYEWKDANPINRADNPIIHGSLVPSSTTQQKPQQIRYPSFNIPGYEAMSNDDKSNSILKFIDDNGLKKLPDPYAGMTMEQKKAKIKSIYNFDRIGKIELTEVQIACLGMFASSPKLQHALSVHGAKDPNNFIMLAVDPAQYNSNPKYDFAFIIECNKRNEGILVKYCSIPEHDQTNDTWFNRNSIELIKFGKNRKNPYYDEAGAAAFTMDNQQQLAIPIKDALNGDLPTYAHDVELVD
jgi:hypothetical protein